MEFISSNRKSFRIIKTLFEWLIIAARAGVQNELHFNLSRNLGRKVADNFTKLSKISFSMEYFTAEFLQLFTEKRQSLAFGWPAGYSKSNPSISGIS